MRPCPVIDTGTGRSCPPLLDVPLEQRVGAARDRGAATLTLLCSGLLFLCHAGKAPLCPYHLPHNQHGPGLLSSVGEGGAHSPLLRRVSCSSLWWGRRVRTPRPEGNTFSVALRARGTIPKAWAHEQQGSHCWTSASLGPSRPGSWCSSAGGACYIPCMGTSWATAWALWAHTT